MDREQASGGGLQAERHWLAAGVPLWGTASALQATAGRFGPDATRLLRHSAVSPGFRSSTWTPFGATRVRNASGVPGQSREGAPVDRQHLLDAKHVARERGFLGPHREEVADWQTGDLRSVEVGDEAHVAEHGRVAGEVHGGPVSKRSTKPAASPR